MKTLKKDTESFSIEYEKIMKTSERTVVVDNQWSEHGDYFQKFSLYEDYTPVKTSGSTVLNTHI